MIWTLDKIRTNFRRDAQLPWSAKALPLLLVLRLNCKAEAEPPHSKAASPPSRTSFTPKKKPQGADLRANKAATSRRPPKTLARPSVILLGVQLLLLVVSELVLQTEACLLAKRL